MSIKRQCSICGKLIPIGTKCECEIERDKKSNKDNNKKYNKKRYEENKEYIKFYNSSQWIKLRELIRNKQGLDLYLYFKEGKIVTDDLYIHHIIPTKDDWTRRLDSNNLICLSYETHEKIHRLYKSGRKEEVQAELLEMVQEWGNMKVEG